MRGLQVTARGRRCVTASLGQMKLFAATSTRHVPQTAASDQTEAPERFENGLVAGPLRQHGANALG
jgi:hypothetical protein